MPSWVSLGSPWGHLGLGASDGGDEDGRSWGEGWGMGGGWMGGGSSQMVLAMAKAQFVIP